MLHSDDPPEEFEPLTREDPSAFSPPPAFGPFRVLHQIGIGALGPVFRTYEPTRDRLVAVKVFRLDIVPEQAQQLAEALNHAAQASLFHPSIVEPIAAGMEGTLAYRAEEYVAAESLDVAMRHYAPAPMEKALPFITQLAGAIDFARAAGVGHGALHPRDIFVTPDEARATGFGVVEALESVGIRAPVRRPYAAPERIDGASWSTPADTFSLAAIAFELLTGRRPSGTGAQIGALPDGPFSAAVHAVLARGMDENPARRFATALSFAAALEAAGRGEAPAPAPATVAPPAVPVAAPEPIRADALDAPRSRTARPGEFEIEKALDPVQQALDDRTRQTAPLVEQPAVRASQPAPLVKAPPVPLMPPAAVPAPSPRATSGAPDRPRSGKDEDDDLDVRRDDDAGDDLVGDLPGDPAGADRFADDFDTFDEEQAAVAESRRPLEAVHETAPPASFAAQPGMFGTAGESEPELLREDTERSRMRILPVALGVVVGLLIGFGIGHFVGTRTSAPQVADATTATGTPATTGTPAAPTGTPAAPTGAATPQQPGQYSEQKVTPPPPTTPLPSAMPPPVPDETPAAGTRSSAPPAATRGRIVVTSTPTRAGVTVNGDWRGRTPLTLDSLPFGRYVIRLVMPGYDVARHEVTLNARDTTQEVRGRLERTAAVATPGAPATRPPTRPAPANVFTGSLYVDSRPRGATVFLDGRSVGQTPLSLPEVPIGAHVVRLELAGKRTWATSTRVVAGETARVTGSLEDRN